MLHVIGVAELKSISFVSVWSCEGLMTCPGFALPLCSCQLGWDPNTSPMKTEFFASAAALGSWSCTLQNDACCQFEPKSHPIKEMMQLKSEFGVCACKNHFCGVTWEWKHWQTFWFFKLNEVLT